MVHDVILLVELFRGNTDNTWDARTRRHRYVLTVTEMVVGELKRGDTGREQKMDEL